MSHFQALACLLLLVLLEECSVALPNTLGRITNALKLTDINTFSRIQSNGSQPGSNVIFVLFIVLFSIYGSCLKVEIKMSTDANVDHQTPNFQCECG